MEMKQVSDNCFAVLIEKNRVCDANSGLINLAGGVVIDTQSDLAHARQMIEMFSKVWPAMPQRVINTHEDADHVWGNQLFEGAEIIAHRSVPERMKHVAEPEEMPEAAARCRQWVHSPGTPGDSTPASWPRGNSCWRTITLTGSNWCCRRPCSTHATN